MENLKIWNSVRQVPQDATKPIYGGRLKGKTDINPVWRIKTLTEQFGMVGVGWYYEITDKQIYDGANGEKIATVDINLYVKVGDEWSKALSGTGGNKLVAKAKTGLYTSDECYKMALTDAISVACKSLGVAADIYWGEDRTKYDTTAEIEKVISNDTCITESEKKGIIGIAQKQHGDDAQECLKDYMAENGLKKLIELKKSKIPEIQKYIAEWSDTRLPPDIG